MLDADSDAAATRYERADLYENHSFDFVAIWTTHWLQIMSGVGRAGAYRDFSGVSVREKPAAVPVDPAPVEPTLNNPARTVPLTIPSFSALPNLDVPSGQDVVWSPITVEPTRLERVSVIVNRAVNQRPATINVGTRQVAYTSQVIYTWSKGDDLTD